VILKGGVNGIKSKLFCAMGLTRLAALSSHPAPSLPMMVSSARSAREGVRLPISAGGRARVGVSRMS